MNNIANTTTLWQLLGKCKVVIPILQRDYAQGRIGHENLREKFLSSIISALNDTKQLKLDFVYGSSDQESRFNPLDGQQRLTTLWLIHWYLAFRLGKLSDPNIVAHLSNFSYETRASSTNFCQRIVKRGPEIRQLVDENIADAIIRQTWIPSLWRQDPTVQSMLRMLSGEQNGKIDGIEELFAGIGNDILQNYWDKLMHPAANCPLVFYQLDLENLGQSDDLYVKMNGRGKPLSDFENFKADLIKYITDQKWSALLNTTNGLPILLDTKWIDFFWKYRNKDISIDDMMFAFINRFLLVQMMMKQIPKNIEDDKLAGSPIDKAFRYLYSFTNKKADHASYKTTGFGVYQTVFNALDGWSLLYDLRTILENINHFNRADLTDCVKYPYGNSTEKFEVVYTSGKNDFYALTIQETICFWAVCQFFKSPRDYKHPQILKQLKQRMRVVWNVCSYQTLEGNKNDYEIRTRSQLRAAICALYNSNYATNKTNTNEEGKISQHIAEEREKLDQINTGQYTGSLPQLQGKTWEEIITEQEKLPIFKGTIRALFTNAQGAVDWNDFDTKYSNLHWYLNNSNDLNSLAYRNLLIYHFDFCKKHHWFPKGDKRDALWRLLLPYEPEYIHKWLMASPLGATQLSSQVSAEPSYAIRSVIQTSLLQDVTDDNGMYVTYSGTCKNDVYWHHQNTSDCVIFNESRDKVLNYAISNGEITLCRNGIHKNCGLFFAKNILFTHHGIEFNWHATGVVFRSDNPEYQLPQPTTLKKLIVVIQRLNLIYLLKPINDNPARDLMIQTITSLNRITTNQP